jgi:hypothetical protein
LYLSSFSGFFVVVILESVFPFAVFADHLDADSSVGSVVDSKSIGSSGSSVFSDVHEFFDCVGCGVGQSFFVGSSVFFVGCGVGHSFFVGDSVFFSDGHLSSIGGSVGHEFTDLVG